MTAPLAALIGTGTALTMGPGLRGRTGNDDRTTARGYGEEGAETLGDPVYRVSATTATASAPTTSTSPTTRRREARRRHGHDRTAHHRGPGPVSSTPSASTSVRCASRAVRPDSSRPARTADHARPNAPERARVTVCVGVLRRPEPRRRAHRRLGRHPRRFRGVRPAEPGAHRLPLQRPPQRQSGLTSRSGSPSRTGQRGVANGQLVCTERLDGDRTAFSYRSRRRWRPNWCRSRSATTSSRRAAGPHGLPLRDIVPTARAAAPEPALALTPGLVDWLEQRASGGPPVRETYGLLPCNSDSPTAFDFTGPFETQTLTLHKPNFLLQAESKIGSHMMHELVHSWFGNSVSPATWADLWPGQRGPRRLLRAAYRYERVAGLTSRPHHDGGAHEGHVRARRPVAATTSGPVAGPQRGQPLRQPALLGRCPWSCTPCGSSSGEDTFHAGASLPRPLPGLLGDDGGLHRRRVEGLRPGPVRLPAGLARRYDDAAHARSSDPTGR
ncbi:M1 family aminopeptidase [Streptomyces sp. L7]